MSCSPERMREAELQPETAAPALGYSQHVSHVTTLVGALMSSGHLSVPWERLPPVDKKGELPAPDARVNDRCTEHHTPGQVEPGFGAGFILQQNLFYPPDCRFWRNLASAGVGPAQRVLAGPDRAQDASRARVSEQFLF